MNITDLEGYLPVELNHCFHFQKFDLTLLVLESDLYIPEFMPENRSIDYLDQPSDLIEYCFVWLIDLFEKNNH